MSCNQFTMDLNGNKLNDLSFTFCVVHGTDYMTFCLHFIDKCFNMYTVLNIMFVYVLRVVGWCFSFLF